MRKKGFAITLIALVISIVMISHTVAIAQDVPVSDEEVTAVSAKTMEQKKAEEGDTLRTQLQERINEKDLAENAQYKRAGGEDGQKQKAAGECTLDQTRERLRTGYRGLNSSSGSASKSRSGSGGGRGRASR